MPYAVPSEFQTASTATASTEVVAFSAGPLRHLRAALIEPLTEGSSGALASSMSRPAKVPVTQVLNFVIFPDPAYDLPALGADLVSLPGGHLVAIDLHPMLPPEAHAAKYLPRVEPLHAQYKESLPWGGDLPEEARPFFSPAALWSRLPRTTEGTATLRGVR